MLMLRLWTGKVSSSLLKKILLAYSKSQRMTKKSLVSWRKKASLGCRPRTKSTGSVSSLFQLPNLKIKIKVKH